MVCAAFALLSLVAGAPYLEATLPGGLPIGNALTALGLCSAAGAAVGLSPRRTALRMLSITALFGAFCWLPVSIALAGNLALNFRGSRGGAWLAFSLAVVAAVLGALLWAWAARWRARYQR